MNIEELENGFLSNPILQGDTLPTIIHRGVVNVKNSEGKSIPTYIVEMIEDESGIEVVTIWGVYPESSPPRKDFTPVTQEITYRTETTLGQLASKLFKPKSKRAFVEKPPLFMTPIVYGTDTFTGKYGKGFHERTPDRIVRNEKAVRIEHGKYTHVFISLESVKWQNPIISAEDLTLRYQANKKLWFDI